MIRPAKNAELVWIVWADAVGESCRHHAENVAGLHLATNTNLGWVVHENERRLILAHGMSDSGELDVFAIPQNCIIERIPVIKKRPRNGTAKTVVPSDSGV